MGQDRAIVSRPNCEAHRHSSGPQAVSRNFLKPKKPKHKGFAEVLKDYEGGGTTRALGREVDGRDQQRIQGPKGDQQCEWRIKSRGDPRLSNLGYYPN